MNWIRTVVIITVPLLIVTLGLELGSRAIFYIAGSGGRDFSTYTNQELDKDLPFILDVNGGRCIEIRPGFNWDQWWGYSAKKLDANCVKEHLGGDTFNVVFMGGSAMFNAEAPNYLTHIDHYATHNLAEVKTINLAESGARHMNMSVLFQREVLPLRPDLVIFLDGYNEFNSGLYGGDPKDDFYWTATGKVRMHKPYRLYIDKVIELSKFLEIALVHTGLYQSSRNVTGVKFERHLVDEAASQYLLDKKNTKRLCEAASISCLFVIQPQIFGSDLNEHKTIIQRSISQMPYHEKIHVNGYTHILKRCEDCIDMSALLHGEYDTYLDPVHFSKRGSELVGSRVRELIIAQMGRNGLIENDN